MPSSELRLADDNEYGIKCIRPDSFKVNVPFKVLTCSQLLICTTIMIFSHYSSEYFTMEEREHLGIRVVIKRVLCPSDAKRRTFYK